MMKITTETFIERAKEKWGDKYDYSEVVYVNDCTKVTILCQEHGKFHQTPNTHYKSECPKCGLLKRFESRKNKLSDLLIKFKEKHGDKYDYSLVEYKKMKSKVKIRCNKHNLVFYQTPEKHFLSKTGGCPECNSIGKGILGKDVFIKKSIKKHGKIYDYKDVIYIDSTTKVKIKCEKHGYFEIVPNSHLTGRGCPSCNRNGSILENRWLDYLDIKSEYRQYKIDKYYVDGFDPVTKTIYEFYGDFWHGNPEKYNTDDINNVSDNTFGELYKKTLEREDYLKSLGYKIVSIWESEYKNIYNE
jgi:Zn finger protein HypA/HybF involved in hydrogenase expression